MAFNGLFTITCMQYVHPGGNIQRDVTFLLKGFPAYQRKPDIVEKFTCMLDEGNRHRSMAIF